MILELIRKPDNSGAVQGTLSFGDTTVHTLEPARLNPAHPGHPCIPAGTYPVALTYSKRFGKVLPEVQHVPGRAGIRIHAGNTEKDSHGCILVGMASKPGFVGQSRVALAYLETWLQENGSGVLIISDK